MAEDTEEKTEESAVTLPVNALVKEAPERNYALFNMPKTGKFAGYRFLADLDKIKADFSSGTVTVPIKPSVRLRRGDGAEETLSQSELTKALAGASADDFKEEKFSVTLPAAAVCAGFKNVTRLLLPKSSEYKGCFCALSNSCIEEAEGGVKVTLSDWMYPTVRKRDGEKTRVSGKDFVRILEEGKDSYSERTKWITVTLPKEAVSDRYDKQSRLHMPKGEYEGYAAYLPNGMIKETKNPGEYLVMMPETRPVRLKNIEGDKKVLSPEEYKKLVEGATAEEYLAVGREERERFLGKMSALKDRIPGKMYAAPNWLDVRVKKGSDGVVFESSSAHSKHVAVKDPGPEGMAFEEAAKYAAERRSDTLGFAFSGDGVVCISLNGCLDGEGKVIDPAAEEILAETKGTYAEKSVSGRDVHIFCLTDAEGLGHASKDGKAELYLSSDYVSVTGEAVTASKELRMYGPESALRKLLSETFPAEKLPGKLTKDDEKKLAAAMSAEGSGETFKSLYEGKNEKGTPEFCDENLMARIACRTLGDVEAMKRIYFSSQRADKSPEHVEHLAMKAKRQTASFVERASKDLTKARRESAAKTPSKQISNEKY